MQEGRMEMYQPASAAPTGENTEDLERQTTILNSFPLLAYRLFKSLYDFHYTVKKIDFVI